MRRVLLAALLAAPAVAAAPVGQPYLKRPAQTPAALYQQVSTDRQLTRRYAKHYNASESTVLRGLRSAKPATLPPGQYTVWLTGRDGLRYPTRQARTRPTHAFRLTLGGGAYLERGTGNPIAPFRPIVNVQIVAEPPAPSAVEVEVPREVLVPAAPLADVASEKRTGEARAEQ